MLSWSTECKCMPLTSFIILSHWSGWVLLTIPSRKFGEEESYHAGEFGGAMQVGEQETGIFDALASCCCCEAEDKIQAPFFYGNFIWHLLKTPSCGCKIFHFPPHFGRHISYVVILLSPSMLLLLRTATLLQLPPFRQFNKKICQQFSTDFPTTLLPTPTAGSRCAERRARRKRPLWYFRHLQPTWNGRKFLGRRAS